jgi:hypothetical protein
VWAAIGVVAGVFWLRWDAVQQDRFKRDKEVTEAKQQQAKIIADASSEIAANKKESDTELGIARMTTKTNLEIREKEVIKYVTKEADLRFPVSVGWVRWHNLAATNGNPNQYPTPESAVVGAESGIGASQTASVVSRNYAKYFETEALLASCAAEYKSVYSVIEALKKAK